MGQNFDQPTPHLITTTKTKALFLLKNLPLLLPLVTDFVPTKHLPHLIHKNLEEGFDKKVNVFFDLTKTIFRRLLRTSKHFWSTNLILTAQIIFLQHFFHPRTVAQLLLKEDLFLNQYYLQKRVLNIRLFGSFFKKVVLGFFKFILNFWPHISRRFLFRQNFLNEWSLLKLTPFLGADVLTLVEF